MRLLVASIIILVLAVGYFAYTEVKYRIRINEPYEPIAKAERIVSTGPQDSDESLGQRHSEQDEIDELIQELKSTSEPELGSLNIAEDPDLELYESFLGAEEECCPEEAIDQPKKPLRERFMDMYLPKGFTRDEINRYTDFTEKQLRREPLDFNEHMEFLELLVRFQPHESNILAYEYWKKMEPLVEVSSWRQSWDR